MFLFCRSRHSGSSPVPGCDGDPAVTKPASGDAASPPGKGGERAAALAGHCLSSLLFLRVCSSTYSSRPTGRRLLGAMGARLPSNRTPTSASAYPDLQRIPWLLSPHCRICSPSIPHQLWGDVPAQRHGEASLTPVKHPMPFVPPGLPVAYKRAG